MCFKWEIRPKKDNFTFVDKKGRSVVDYILVSCEQFTKFDQFEVLLMSDTVNRSNYGTKCRIPDHSIIKCVINLSDYDGLKSGQTVITKGRPIIKNECCTERTYKLNGVPLDFLENEQRRSAIFNLCNRFLHDNVNQNEVDDVYENFLSECRSEMDTKIPFKDSKVHFSSQTVKRSKKPWWNNNLQRLWDKCRKAEKNFS